jgi:mono/diheme cytochrome c family protein/rhodanese-related sulfurtransferase
VNRIAAVAVSVALVVAGCSSGSATPEPGSRNSPPGVSSRATPGAPSDASIGVPRDADVSHLAAGPLYVALCAPCHGADAKGYAADHAPSLVNPTFLESASDDFLHRSIAMGRPGTSMGAYGKARGGPLDDAGVDRLVHYLREQGPAARALPPATAGDPDAGAAIYAARCVSCHGDRKTRGEAMALTNPGLLAAASDAFLRHAIVHGRPGTKMEAFAGALSDRDIDNVVSYIRAVGNVAPEVGLLPEPTGKEPLVINPSGKAPSFKLRADPCPPVLPGAVSSCKPDPRFVSVDQVARAVAARQRLVIIDARPTSEWRRVHIAGAVSIPYHELTRLAELPRDGTWIVAYCACPHHLSGIVVDELRKRGYAHAAVLDEGINDWHRRGFPVIAADGVPLPPADPSGAPPAGTIR